MFAGYDNTVFSNAPAPHAVRLRNAVHADIEDIIAVESRSNARFAEAGHAELLDQRIPAGFVARAIEHHAILVGVVDDEVVGFLQVTRLGGERCVGQVSVVPEYGRRGIGTALLAATISLARHAGDASIVLSTFSDVAWNAPWYEGHGFRVVPEVDWSPSMRSLAAERVAAGAERGTLVFMRLTLTSTWR